MKWKTPLLLVGASAVAAAAYKAYDFFKHNEVTLTIEVDEKDDVVDADTCGCEHHDHDDSCDCDDDHCECDEDDHECHCEDDHTVDHDA